MSPSPEDLLAERLLARQNSARLFAEARLAQSAMQQEAANKIGVSLCTLQH